MFEETNEKWRNHTANCLHHHRISLVEKDMFDIFYLQITFSPPGLAMEMACLPVGKTLTKGNHDKKMGTTQAKVELEGVDKLHASGHDSRHQEPKFFPSFSHL